jgi:hypothetical protein
MEGEAERADNASIGDRSVAIAGSFENGTIIPGDRNIVGPNVTLTIHNSPLPGEGHALAQGNGDDSRKGQKTGKRAPRPFTELRRLFAYYWKPIVTLAALVPTVLKILHSLGLSVTMWPERANPETQAVLIGLGLSVLVVIRFPRVAYAVTRWIVPPPAPRPPGPRVFRGPRSYNVADAEEFHGRNADGDDCWNRIRSKPLFVLEGESGCGKSSLLNVDLLPRASKEFRVVSCRCGEDPFGKLRSALLGERYEQGRRYGKPALREAIESATQSLGETQSKPLLVCVDQFEELFVTVRDQVRRQFFMAIKEAIEEGKLRLVVGIRKDFSDLLLDARRDVDPDNTAFAFDRDSYYTLRSFSAEQAEAVLERVLDHEEIHDGDPLAKQEHKDFVQVLVQVLLRPPSDTRLSPQDEHRVIPVELQMVGWTYESILGRRFSAAEFRRLGGKAGLYRHYIEDAKEYVFRKTGIPGETSLRILRRLISLAGTKWEQSVADIAPGVGLSAEQIDRVLEAFAERFLVRRLPSEQPGPGEVGSTFRRYELMHEHLVQLLEEAPQRELQRLRDAEARLRFWRERTRNLSEPRGDIAPQSGRSRLRAFRAWLASFFAQPIPIGETLRLWRYARGSEDRRMMRRNLRGFLTMLLTVSVLFAAPCWAGWVYYKKTHSYQRYYIIEYAPDKDLARSGLTGESVLVFNKWLAALVTAGRPDSAMAAAAKLTAPVSQSRAYGAIAEAAAKADDRGRAAQAIDAALGVAAKVTDPDAQYRAYAAIAEAAAKAGDRGRAAQAIDAALGAVKVRGTGFLSREYAAIAEAAAKAGLFDAALWAAAKVTVPEFQSWTYAAIAEAMAKAGLIAAAKKAERQIPEGYADRSKAQAAIAQALAREGHFYDARDYCKDCERLDMLKAYTTILEEYTNRYPPSVKKANR